MVQQQQPDNVSVLLIFSLIYVVVDDDLIGTVCVGLYIDDASICCWGWYSPDDKKYVYIFQYCSKVLN